MAFNSRDTCLSVDDPIASTSDSKRSEGSGAFSFFVVVMHSQKKRPQGPRRAANTRTEPLLRDRGGGAIKLAVPKHEAHEASRALCLVAYRSANQRVANDSKERGVFLQRRRKRKV